MVKQRKVFGMFAFLPEHCRVCDKLIWFEWFYKMPWWIILAYNYGPCANEVHCRKCHKRMMAEDGHCTFCDWD